MSNDFFDKEDVISKSNSNPNVKTKKKIVFSPSNSQHLVKNETLSKAIDFFTLRTEIGTNENERNNSQKKSKNKPKSTQSQQTSTEFDKITNLITSENVTTNNNNDSTSRSSVFSFFSSIKRSYNSLINSIIRPPRAEYTIDALGPSEFKVKGEKFIREDFTLNNSRNLKLCCSHWRPQNEDLSLPSLIYLHGNASCRLEALEYLDTILPLGFSLLSLDTSGCGLSDGEYISLGWYEQDDVLAVVNYLKTKKYVSSISIWGRSMGAVTALMFSAKNPSISCLILDSPFISFNQLAADLLDNSQVSIPKFAFGLTQKIIRSSIKFRAKFDINNLNPVNSAAQCSVPLIIGVAKDDLLIPSYHSEIIHNVYKGEKSLIVFEGNHNSKRPLYFLDSVSVWIYNTVNLRTKMSLLNTKNKKKVNDSDKNIDMLF